jgi:hypothetical protein
MAIGYVLWPMGTYSLWPLGIHILWPLGIIIGHLVYVITICYILWPLGIFGQSTKKNLAIPH